MAAAGIGYGRIVGRHEAEAVEVVMSEPVFPTHGIIEGVHVTECDTCWRKGIKSEIKFDCRSSGLSKREYAAIHAMQGFCQSIGIRDWAEWKDNQLAKDVGDKSCRMADALLAELEKKP